MASVALIVNCKGWPAVTVLLPMAARTGAALAVTVIVIVSEAVKEPSETWNRIFEKLPVCDAVGVQVNIRVADVKVAPEGSSLAE